MKCTQLQDDYFGIKDDARYHNFTAFCNKMNENHSIIIEQKTRKPMSIFKSKTNHMDLRNNGDNGGQGGRGRGRFCGRCHGGRSGGRGRGRIRQGGRGWGSHGGCKRGGYNRNEGKQPHVYLSCLQNNIDLNNIIFDDNIRNNELTQEQRNAII